jgi:hypothetical protein
MLNVVVTTFSMVPVFMFKALLLQGWYSLSDPNLERLFVRDLVLAYTNLLRKAPKGRMKNQAIALFFMQL